MISFPIARLRHTATSDSTAPAYAKDRDYSYGLNDPDDGHVAHAAITGKADAIVTDDRRAGFSATGVLVAADIATVHPHQLAANTGSAHPHAGVRALQEMSNRQANPAQTPEQILDLLVPRHNMNEVAEILLPLVAAGTRQPPHAAHMSPELSPPSNTLIR